MPSKELKEAMQRLNLTEEQAWKVINDRKAADTEAVKSYTPEEFEVTLQVIEAERLRREEADSVAFTKKLADMPDVELRKLTQKWGF
jgi:hypothetical protein